MELDRLTLIGPRKRVKPNLVALAHTSNADYLVSGDQHLAGVKGKVPVNVLTPRQFIELLESESL